ncbi:MAG: hypothetical protein AAF602_04700 [Myxococcota bacterium]
MKLDDVALAQLRILVAVARADGRLDLAEQQLLVDRCGVEGAELLKRVLAEDIDVDAAIAELDDAQRRATYHAAYAITNADGRASYDEVVMLRRIVDNEGESSLAGQIWGETADTFVPGRILPVADPAQRDGEITEDILKYATIAAVAGATPVPGFGMLADVAVVTLQTKLVHDIAQYTGQETTPEAVRDFVGGLAGSTALRIAINEFARLLPVAGSIWGASTSFASTYAIGRVAQRWFEGGQQLSDAELTGLFDQARAEGKAAFADREQAVAEAGTAHEAQLVDLAVQLGRGDITRADYDRAVADLATA